jgi:acetoin utilization deacetylase AcuC-like enzyme
MITIFSDPLFQEHITGPHPECPARLAALATVLKDYENHPLVTHQKSKAVALDTLTQVHDAKYVAALEKFAQQGGGNWDRDTVVCPKSYQVALHSAGAVVTAVDDVMTGKTARALCLVRPPGHHALKASAMGFCLFNNIAVGAQHAISQHNLSRVLIVDWDVHHGNGTQDLFYDRGDIFFLSAHRSPFYPGTGEADETGTGQGIGATFNLPLNANTPARTYREKFLSLLETVAKKSRPELILISAGFDAHYKDPIGGLGLDIDDFAWLTQQVTTCAQAYCQGKVVSVLEGGYNIQILPDCIDSHLKKLLI